jgi:hypothetical protein
LLTGKIDTVKLLATGFGESAMNKAELESHRAQYDGSMVRVSDALHAGLYREGLAAAVSALEYVDGMMRHAERYESASFSNVSAIEVILKYGPVLLDTDCLDRLEGLLKTQRRVARNTSDDLGQLLIDARTKLDECYRFWSFLEANGSVRQEELSRLLGGEQQMWVDVAATWEAMGLLRRVPEGHSYRISIILCFEEEAQAKCISCGAIHRGPKKRFYEAVTCDGCRKASVLVLVSM